MHEHNATRVRAVAAAHLGLQVDLGSLVDEVLGDRQLSSDCCLMEWGPPILSDTSAAGQTEAWGMTRAHGARGYCRPRIGYERQYT